MTNNAYFICGFFFGWALCGVLLTHGVFFVGHQLRMELVWRISTMNFLIRNS
jgi:hypothetical protein